MTKERSAIVIGGGPAGLMAAEVLRAGGCTVDLFDAMPSVGRKLLMAGRGGLNITHSEPSGAFMGRYSSARTVLEPMLKAFGAEDLRAWVHALGIETFIGTSGRVFPSEMKAAPLLRAWLKRLRGAGVRFHVRHRWTGWTADSAVRFDTPQGEVTAKPDIVVLALGGGSWPQLGSDAAWVAPLKARGIEITPLRSANCGFDVAWTDYFRERFAGQPVKHVATHINGTRRQGEFMVTDGGVEGGLIYALSASARDEIAAKGKAVVPIDLVPTRDLKSLTAALARPRGKNSLANYLRKYAGIEGVKAGLLREVLAPDDFDNATRLAQTIKAFPLTLTAPRPLEEAISTAGGVAFTALDDNLMLRQAAGVFCAGEMLDWEAPTGGYLLTACFASGRQAGQGALRWLQGI
jgi:uncharacterized flavoprotein (TIGR03862 family)